jgi:hypothetical protein
MDYKAKFEAVKEITSLCTYLKGEIKPFFRNRSVSPLIAACRTFKNQLQTIKESEFQRQLAAKSTELSSELAAGNGWAREFTKQSAHLIRAAAMRFVGEFGSTNWVPSYNAMNSTAAMKYPKVLYFTLWENGPRFSNPHVIQLSIIAEVLAAARHYKEDDVERLDCDTLKEAELFKALTGSWDYQNIKIAGVYQNNDMVDVTRRFKLKYLNNQSECWLTLFELIERVLGLDEIRLLSYIESIPGQLFTSYQSSIDYDIAYGPIEEGEDTFEYPKFTPLRITAWNIREKLLELVAHTGDSRIDSWYLGDAEVINLPPQFGGGTYEVPIKPHFVPYDPVKLDDMFLYRTCKDVGSTLMADYGRDVISKLEALLD